MADEPQTSGASTSRTGGNIAVPEDVRAQHADLIALILNSESMNDEERQYWVNILPIMTPDQIKSLRDILDNEKKQLAAIDAKYSKEIEQIGQEQFLKKVAEERKKRSEERKTTQKTAEKKEAQDTEDILKQIEGM